MKETKTFSLTAKEVALITDITGIEIPATGSQDIEVPESITLPLLQIVKDLKPALLALKPLLNQVKDLPWGEVKLTQSEPEQYEATQAVDSTWKELQKEKKRDGYIWVH